MARPRGSTKPDHHRRNVQVKIWCTPAEKARIDANAERAGVPVSTYIRSLALGKPLRRKPGQQADALIRQLTRIGNNLNQLLEHALAGRIDGAEHLEHVQKRLFLALEFWTGGGPPPRSIADETVTLLAHEGVKLNALARQANAGEPVSDKALLTVLHDLTARLRPFAP